MPLPLLSVRPLGDYVRALVLGAKSAIAQAIVERLDGYDFALAARGCSELEPFARGPTAQALVRSGTVRVRCLGLCGVGALAAAGSRARRPLRLGRPRLRLSRRRAHRAARDGEASAHPQRELHWRGHRAGAFGQLSGGKGHADWHHRHLVCGRRPGPSEQLCVWSG